MKRSQFFSPSVSLYILSIVHCNIFDIESIHVYVSALGCELPMLSDQIVWYSPPNSSLTKGGFPNNDPSNTQQILISTLSLFISPVNIPLVCSIYGCPYGAPKGKLSWDALPWVQWVYLRDVQLIHNPVKLWHPGILCPLANVKKPG